MEQLAWPTIFCHDLEIDAEGRVAKYRLRQPDQPWWWRLFAA